MKSLFVGLIVLATAGSVKAASTDTVQPSLEDTMNAIAADMAQMAQEYNRLVVEATVPVEQKVVEIHMTSAPLYPEFSKKKRKAQTLPLYRNGTCSGSFITDSGDILTAKHCVEGFETFEVQTYDQRKYKATVVSTSAVHDLALLHVDRRNTAYFELAPDSVRGQTVFILGSPLGITNTLSTGVIAKIDGDFTLVDCSALPGNSGGPVFDVNDRLVGVLNAGYTVMFGVTHLNQALSLDAVHFFLKKTLEKK